MAEDSDAPGEEIFSSEVIDLSAVDLSGLSKLPNSVLRASLWRVCAELTGDSDAAAYFQSSLRGARQESKPAPPGRHGRIEGIENDQ